MDNEKLVHMATDTGLMVVVDGVGVLLDPDVDLAAHMPPEQIGKIAHVLTELGEHCGSLAKNIAMEWKPVQSSNIKAVGYESYTTTLGVEFESGMIYHYDGVPQDEYEQFVAAPSVGRFFHTQIKDHYPYRKFK